MPETAPTPLDTDKIYNALSKEPRRAIVRELASDAPTPAPETTAAYHIHVPVLADANIVIDDNGILHRGPAFDSAAALLRGTDPSAL